MSVVLVTYPGGSQLRLRVRTADANEVVRRLERLGCRAAVCTEAG